MAIDNLSGKPKDASTGTAIAAFCIFAASFFAADYFLATETSPLVMLVFSGLGALLVRLDREIEFLKASIEHLKQAEKQR